MSKEDADILIYETQVSVENVELLLHKELLRLVLRYGRRVRDDLFAIALGPNAYQVWEIATKQKRRSQDLGRHLDEADLFQDIRIVCGPLPFVIPLFTSKGWWAAHEEAKRISSLTGGLDS